MSQSVITSAFVEWKAQQAIDNKPVVLDEFVLAFVPDLDITNPIDPDESLPPAAQIVHRQAVSRAGMVNQNAVVYSVVMGTEVGDFDFNWIGIINSASGVVATIIHAPTQRKIKNSNGQEGNVLTRSVLIEFNGARTETQIEVPAETWQIDFTARMTGMDERQRVENIDTYGAAAFFENGFLVTKKSTAYSIAPGVGYVAGLRTQLASASPVLAVKKPVKIWVDVAWKGTLTSAWNVETTITAAEDLADYVKDGQQHYVFAVASIDAAGEVTDLRPKGSLSEQSSDNDYVRKDKNLGDLDNIEKARETLKLKSAALLDVGTSEETVAAGDDPRIVDAVPKTRKINGWPLDEDVELWPGDIGALPAGSNAVSASKLQVPRLIAGVPFDGTKSIEIKAGNVGAYTKAESDARYQLKNTASLAPNGWHRDGSTGLITQWMRVNRVGEYLTSFKFPIAFPSICTAITFGQINVSNGSSQVNIWVSAYDRTGATIRLEAGEKATFVEAKGY